MLFFLLTLSCLPLFLGIRAQEHLGVGFINLELFCLVTRLGKLCIIELLLHEQVTSSSFGCLKHTEEDKIYTSAPLLIALPTLDAADNWQLTWEKLDGRFTWQIVEKNVPDGYTVTVQAENGFVTVTNTKKTPDKP